MTEYKRVWAGVSIPRWLRVFDCRTEPGHETDLDPDGRWRPGSARAIHACGLEHNSSIPLGVQSYQDYRNLSEADLAVKVQEMVSQAKKSMRAYRHALKHPSTDGGGVAYPVTGVALCNYGWSLFVDRRQGFTYSFNCNVSYP